MLEITAPARGHAWGRDRESASGAAVVVALHNPTTAPWRVEVLLHYEGGRGKPMPKYERRAMSVEPGRDSRLEVPSMLEEPPQGDHERACWSLESAELLGAVGECDGVTAYKVE